MKNHFPLSRCQKYHQIFIFVFSLVEQKNEEFKKKPLQFLSEPLLNASGSLSRITPNRAMCLAVFTECKDFVFWLKKTMKGNSKRFSELS